jgi:hypothetical protein
MKQVYLLVLSLSGIVSAQTRDNRPNTEKIFGQQGFGINAYYQVNLGSGNRMVLELEDITALRNLTNIDSLLQVFSLDLMPLHDSMAEPTSSKRIDYVVDTNGNKKIRIQQFKPKGANFLISGGGLSSLKLEQDTIVLSGLTASGFFFRKKQIFYHYRLSFYLNLASELEGYIDGRLNQKMKEIGENIRGVWHPLINGLYVMQSDSLVCQKRIGGAHFRANSYLTSYLGVNIQNYKSYFVPSVSLGIAIHLDNGRIIHDLGLYWEPQFLFAANQVTGKLSTYQNDYITLFYKMGFPGNAGVVRYNRDQLARIVIRPFLSFGYLYQQQGSFYYNQKIRLGFCQVNFKDPISLEPVLYFHDFFRQVSPGLKLVVRFN